MCRLFHVAGSIDRIPSSCNETQPQRNRPEHDRMLVWLVTMSNFSFTYVARRQYYKTQLREDADTWFYEWRRWHRRANVVRRRKSHCHFGVDRTSVGRTLESAGSWPRSRRWLHRHRRPLVNDDGEAAAAGTPGTRRLPGAKCLSACVVTQSERKADAYSRR